MISYCLPIISSSSAAAAALIEAEDEHYQLFEVWLDYLDDFDIAAVGGWCERLGPRLILLFRRRRLEAIRMPQGVRREVLQIAAASGSFIDLDIAAQADDLAALASASSRPPTILSYHNYDQTPEHSELLALIDRMTALRADIYKLSCLCNAPSDALRLLGVQQELAARGVRHLVLGMGRHGMVTRIFGTLWGNEFIFAPRERAAETAPGQLTRAELERIFEILEG